MNRRLAGKAWRLPVFWAAYDEPPAVTATVVPAGPAPEVHHHYHVHLPPGMTPEGLAAALPQQRAAIEISPTKGEQ